MSGAAQLADLVQELGITIAVAESLTCGSLAAEIGKGENASQWLAGGVVAYTERTKFDVLGVEEGPVVTDRAARQMAEGVRRLLKADAAVAVTGVGGPGPEEGRPSGTVFIASAFRGRTDVRCHEFEGDPPDVIEQSVAAAIDQLTSTLTA
jgi:nicotinamide-nucleotide amidase